MIKLDYYEKAKEELATRKQKIEGKQLTAGLESAENLYAIKAIERDLLLLESLKEYPKLSFYYTLLETDESKYRLFKKGELFHLINEKAFAKGKLELEYRTYIKEYSSLAKDSKRAKEIELIIQALGEKINELKKQMTDLRERRSEYSEKTKEQLKTELLCKFKIMNCEELAKIPSIGEISNRDRAITSLMQNKADNDLLVSSVNKTIFINKQAKNTSIKVHLPIYYYQGVTEELEQTYLMKDNELELNSDQLEELQSFINQRLNKLIVNGALNLAYFNPKTLFSIININSHDYDAANKLFRNYYEVIDNETLSYFRLAYRKYQTLSKKIIKSKADKEMIKKLEGSLNASIKHICLMIKRYIENLYLDFADQIGGKFLVYPTSAINIANNFGVIEERYSKAVDYLRTLSSKLALAKVDLFAAVSDINEEKKPIIRLLETRTSLDLEDADFGVPEHALGNIYKKTFLALQINTFDEQIDKDIIEYVGVQNKPKKMTL